MPHFNKLTPAQAERLAMLAEECGEVIQIVGKILRHGYDSHHPCSGISNRELLSAELIDVVAVASVICAKDKIADGGVDAMAEAWKKKLRYAHHQEGKP